MSAEEAYLMAAKVAGCPPGQMRNFERAGLLPRFFIHQPCARLVECLPSLQDDPNRPEDVLKVDADEDGVGGDEKRPLLRADPAHAQTLRSLVIRAQIHLRFHHELYSICFWIDVREDADFWANMKFVTVRRLERFRNRDGGFPPAEGQNSRRGKNVGACCFLYPLEQILSLFIPK